MSNEEKKTFTKEERSEFFRQAEQEYFDKTYGELPPLDKSFMKTEKWPGDKSSKRKRYFQIAAAAVVMICIVSVAQPLIGNNDVFGDKGILHRLYESVTGMDTDEQDGSLAEGEQNVEITDLSKIKEVLKICPNLYVPAYMPEGYTLEKLVVKGSETGVVRADYSYKNGEKELFIGMTFAEDKNGTYGSSVKGHMIRLEDRIIRPTDNDNVVEVYTEEGMIGISGEAALDEMIEIARQLKKA